MHSLVKASKLGQVGSTSFEHSAAVFGTVVMNFASFLASVDGLRSSLEEGNLNEERIESDYRRICSVLQSDWLQRMMSLPDEDAPQNFGRMEKIAQTAVKLWNTVVAKLTGRSVSFRCNALLRQLCFNLESCAVKNLAKSDKIEIRRSIMMGIKVGKAWYEAGEREESLDVLETTKMRIESLLKAITDEGNPDWYMADKVSLQQDLFSVLCAMSEVTSSRGQHEEVINLVEKASSLPFLSGNSEQISVEYKSEIQQLCALTYNFGLKSANEQRYDQAVDWLTRSFEVGKRGRNIRNSVLAKILRLLAYCYSEKRMDDCDTKALNTLELAESYGSHPSGIHLKLKVLARDNATANEVIAPVVDELISHGDASIELLLSACRYLNSHNRFVLCDKALETLQQKYAKSPQVARIKVQRFEYTLGRSEENEAIDLARSFLKDEQAIRNMDKDLRNSVHLLLWEQSEKCQEKGDTDSILSWYDLSLLFYGLSCGGEDNQEVNLNIAKIQRNRSSCMIGLGRIEDARSAAEESARLDGQNPRSDFALFKVAVCEGNQTQALEIITRLAKKFDSDTNDERQAALNDSNATIHGLICLCAQLAFEREESAIAINALRHAAETTENRAAKLVALRSLVRLHVRRMEGDVTKIPQTDKPTFVEDVIENALSAIEDGLKVLLDVLNRPLQGKEIESRQHMALSSQEEKFESTEELLHDEAEWFMKISWNMALESKSYVRLMKKLFYLCHEFLGLHTTDSAILTRQKTCLLMCSSAALEVSKSSNNRKDLENELEFALNCIEKHRLICDRLGNDSSARQEKESLMRALYEFEARAKLSPAILTGCDGMVTTGMEDLERLFERIISLPQATVKTLETIATLCTEYPANHTNLAKRALKTAIKRLQGMINASGDRDMDKISSRFSILYRTLVGLAVTGGCDNDPVSKEEALTYVRNAVELIAGPLKKFYPEQECLWLTVKSWNIGARLYAAGHVIPAEKWCSTAMQLLVHLKHYKANYDAHMGEIYQEILAKRNSQLLDGEDLGRLS